MKRMILFSQLIAISLLSMTSVLAQEPTENVTMLTPDEYTEMMLGNVEIPSPSGIYRIDSSNLGSKSTHNTSDVTPFIKPDLMEEVPIAAEDRYTIAYYLFISRLTTDIEKLGIPNSIKLYANGYDISDESAKDIVDVILETNSLHLGILEDIKQQNCLTFERSVSRGDDAKAVIEFNQDEENINVATLDYFRGVDVKLAATIPGNVYEHFQTAIAQTSGAVKSYNIVRNTLSDDSAIAAVDAISSQCQSRLN